MHLHLVICEIFDIFLCGFSLALASTGPDGSMVLWFYVGEHPKAQPAAVSVLKRLRRRDHGLRSHPTDCKSG